ncbi:MAG: PIN domain-containing protein [Acidobacteria bacterium]|nr:PIN domain-containing protein [Acidobacteriota bacterium]
MSDFLVDTNILVYAYDRSEMAKKAKAQTVLVWLEANQAGVLSTQVLGEFFNSTTRKLVYKLTEAEAYRSIQRYLSAWRIVTVTGAIVLEAARATAQYQIAYWDAQIWAAAKLNQIPAVLSEDFQHGQTIEGVQFLNPLKGDFPGKG